MTGGSLPSGLTLDAAAGLISGIPTTAGTSVFTVTASNGVAPDVSVLLTVVTAGDEVAPAPAAPAPSLPATGAGAGETVPVAAALLLFAGPRSVSPASPARGVAAVSRSRAGSGRLESRV